MSGKIPQAFIDELLILVDIVDLIDAKLQLKKTGRNFVAKCPFHNEKTPSFSVNREKQMFYCFGCGVGGNVITFVMNYDHLGFVEAVEDLAEFAGITLPEREASDDNSERSDLNAIYSLQKQVTDFYSDQLFKKPAGRKAIRYLKNRGVTGDVARLFLLGYAPPGWNTLVDAQFDLSMLVNAGLSVKNDAGRCYDRFRDRVVFPIRDRRGRVIGFGGRVLDDSVPKYLNSPETAVFQKGKELYGLYELLQNATKPERILVVEGYMDVIALAQNGIENSVATLGTATSRNHVETLFRYTKEIVFCFDGDKAGYEAAWRAVEVAMPSLRDGLQIRIMHLDLGSDPDSYVRHVGAERFCTEAAGATVFSDYFFDRLGSGLDLSGIEGRANLVAKAKPLLTRLPNGVLRELMRNRLKDIAKIDSIELSASKMGQNGHAKFQLSKKSRLSPSPVRMAVAILVQYPETAKNVDLKAACGIRPINKGLELLYEVLKILHEKPQITSAGLIERFRGRPAEKYVNALAQFELLVSDQGLELELTDALARIEQREKERTLTDLLHKAEENELNDQERNELKRLLRGSQTSGLD